MRLVLAVLSALLLASMTQGSTLDTIIEREGPASGSFAAFQGFMAEFDRVYDTPSIMAERFAIFQENMREAAELNRRKPTAEFGVTRFSDMSRDEWEAEWLAPLPDASETVASESLMSVPRTLTSAPNSVDWRSKVNPIKDQKRCGSCWAFSAMAAVEGALVAAGEPLVDGSEQAVVDCDKRSSGCRGGWMNWGIDQIAKDGVKTTEDYPYKAKKKKCKAKDAPTVSEISGVNVRCANYEWAPKDIITEESCTDDESKIAVAERVQSIGINAEMMISYRGGILDTDDKECEVILNHGVNLVGYDSEDGVDYWIIRNSWGTRWGEDGHIRVIMGKNACGIDVYQIEAVV